MIKFNEVTWYSKLAAILFFIGILPVLTFYIGTKYQEAKSINEIPSPQVSISTTNNSEHSFIKILSPKEGERIAEYQSIKVTWEVSEDLKNKSIDVYVSDPRKQLKCRPEYDSERTASYECTEALVANVPAFQGSYTVEDNPGCRRELPIAISLKIGTIATSVSPVILQGGACDPG